MDSATISIQGLPSKQSRSRSRNVGVPNKHTTANLENAASRRTTAYHCMDDVTTSLARSLHNGGKLEVERAALCVVALRCKWVEGRSRSGVPQEVRPVVPVTTSSPRLSFRARSSHCQVLALPLTHSPEGGSQWCQITPGVPTPRLPGVCGCTCVWSALRHTGAMWGGGGRFSVKWQPETTSATRARTCRRLPA